MTYLLGLLLLLIMLASLAFLFNDGIWGNALRLINVLVAALLAMNYFEPLADWLEKELPSFDFLWDFLSLWALFCLLMIVFRALTDRISRVKVRFLGLADRIGSGILSAWIGWVLICFTLTTLHAALLGKTFLFGAFQSDQPMFLGMLSPDKEWLGFTQGVSNPQGGVFYNAPTEVPLHDYIAKYQERRASIEDYPGKTGSFRINPDAIAQPAPPPVAAPVAPPVAAKQNAKQPGKR